MASLMETFEQQYAALSADITSKTSRLSDLSGGMFQIHRTIIFSVVNFRVSKITTTYLTFFLTV